MPPPDPRSSTVCPGSRAKSAVGLPQPSDAATASGGRSRVSDSEYRFDVMGSPQPQAEGPQQLALPPDLAIAAYFSRTACCTDVSVMSHLVNISALTNVVRLL